MRWDAAWYAFRAGLASALALRIGIGKLWRYRLKVRTEPSQGSNPGSSPGIATNLQKAANFPIKLAHPDKFDGFGYHPTKGSDIPVEARIISVADVYDSLVSDRPYRKSPRLRRAT